MFATSTKTATFLLTQVSCRSRPDAWRRSAQGRVERAGLVGRPEGLPVSGAQRAPWRELAHDVGSAIGQAVALPGRQVGGAQGGPGVGLRRSSGAGEKRRDALRVGDPGVSDKVFHGGLPSFVGRRLRSARRSSRASPAGSADRTPPFSLRVLANPAPPVERAAPGGPRPHGGRVSHAPGRSVPSCNRDADRYYTASHRRPWAAGRFGHAPSAAPRESTTAASRRGAGSPATSRPGTGKEL